MVPFKDILNLILSYLNSTLTLGLHGLYLQGLLLRECRFHKAFVFER